MEYAADGLFKAIIFLYFFINFFFVIEQIKLVNCLKIHNLNHTTKKIWLWTQLIPIWGYLAFLISIFKIENQFKVFLSENDNIDKNDIKKFSTSWGIVYIIFLAISFEISLIKLFVIIPFVVFWIHIYQVRKSINIYQYRLTNP